MLALNSWQSSNLSLTTSGITGCPDVILYFLKMFIFITYYMFVCLFICLFIYCVCVCTPPVWVEIRRELLGVDSLSSSCRSRGWNLDCQAWKKVSTHPAILLAHTVLPMHPQLDDRRIFLLLPGIGPRTPYMLVSRSTTVLHPPANILYSRLEN